MKELEKRNIKINIKNISSKEELKKNMKIELDNLLHKRKEISNLIYSYNKINKNIKELHEKSNYINNKILIIKKKINSLNNYINNFVSKIPNFLLDNVPFGKESKDLDIYYWGEKKNFNFKIKDYIYLGELNGLDLKTPLKISGKRFIIMKNKIARINRALIQFMLDTHIINHGYEEIYVPLIVNKNCLYGTGQLPKFSEEIFYIKDSKKNKDSETHALIPTSEVPLINIMRNTIIKESDFPIKMVSYTQCFRSEIGSYGKKSKGIIRLHQFDKVEIVQIIHPKKSVYALEELTNHAENILKLLNLHYRKILLCAKNTPFSSCKTYDLEVWFPYENKYIEVSSCSNTSDFQSRRILSKYKNKYNKNNFVHIINGSGLAINRVLASIIENYQNINMEIEIPEVLKKYIN